MKKSGASPIEVASVCAAIVAAGVAVWQGIVSRQALVQAAGAPLLERRLDACSKLALALDEFDQIDRSELPTLANSAQCRDANERYLAAYRQFQIFSDHEQGSAFTGSVMSFVSSNAPDGLNHGHSLCFDVEDVCDYGIGILRLRDELLSSCVGRDINIAYAC